MSNALEKLAAAGVAVWLDDLSRPRILSGNLAHIVDRGDIVGVATNPTSFAKAIGSGAGYEDQLRDLAKRGVGVDEAVRLLTTWDVRAACDVLRPVFDRTECLDGRVSIDVDPRLAKKAGAAAAEARGLWWLVDRPNLFIKIPATREGLVAIAQTIAAGISVNVTLIFSLERYAAVLDAYMTGLETRVAKGESLAALDSVASIFVSRVDTEVDRRLAAASQAASAVAAYSSLRGQAALATCQLAYRRYEQALASERWMRLADRGARMQRLLWASPGAKEPSFADTRYVVDFVAPNTVNTLPETTLSAVKHHGDIRRDAVLGGYEPALRAAQHLKQAGVDFEDVAATLEAEGVCGLEDSWRGLIASVALQLGEIEALSNGETSDVSSPATDRSAE